VKLELEGSSILVTGASSGIGRELARQLADRAKVLILVARRKDRLHELATELLEKESRLQVITIACDLADRRATDDMLARVEAEVGSLDVLVNNAGLGDFGLFEQTPWRKVQQLIDINITALTYLAYKILPGMIARRRGGILNVSSGFGLHMLPGFSVYSATKHYVTALSDGLRYEAHGTGVVITQLCPGPVKTEFEEVATSQGAPAKTPAWLEISPQRCARAALRGFVAGRAMVIPGLLIPALLALGAVTPRFIRRWVYGPIAAWLRKSMTKAPA
jgi:short-subunit dehydrogenase